MQITCPKVVGYVVAKRKCALEWAREKKYLASTVLLLQAEAVLEKGRIKACEKIRKEVKGIIIKGDGSKSVLFDGCKLAKELQDLEKSEVDAKDKWKIMSKVWVEMLSYAAIRGRPHAHAQQLSKGGELLMAHFGLEDQFLIDEGHTRAKFIFQK